MSDLNSQNNIDSTQKYTPLTNEYDTPSNKTIQGPQIIQAVITPKENNLNKNSGEYTIYKNPYDINHIFCLIILIIMAIFGFIYFIFNFKEFGNYSYFVLFLPVTCFILGFCLPSVYYIIYDSSQKRIILKRAKLFKCIITTSNIIQINDIQKVILEKYDNSEWVHFFSAIFILNNSRRVTAVEIIDKGEEYSNVFQSLKKVLPEEIYFEELCNYKYK